MRAILACLIVVCLPAALSAQLPTINVVGTGRLEFAQPAESLAAAQAYVYKAYVDTRPAVTLTVTCVGTASPFICSFPLADLKLTATHSLGLSATLIAADGGGEGARSGAPFVLLKLGLPAAPIPTSFKVVPGGS